MITFGQVGLGYWGPNLLRNFNGLAQARVKVCCDLDEAALRRVGSQYPGYGDHDGLRRAVGLTRRSRRW